MSQVKIEALLLNKIGLAPSAIGSNMIARAVSKRRLVCALPDLDTYLQRLQTSPTELEELIEEVVVPETSFFRDRQPFTYLETYVKSEWLLNPNRGMLRLLSVPCSSGEEPYSIAMTLLNSGLTADKFLIDAVDISKKALVKATTAIYSKNSFRGNDRPGEAGYFQPTQNGYELSQLVRQRVNFIQGNILEPSFLTNKKYDIIFCRNLLIYFDSTTCLRAIDILDRSLTPQGLLFVGSAETSMIPIDRFGSIRYPFSFAYRKKSQNIQSSPDRTKQKTELNVISKPDRNLLAAPTPVANFDRSQPRATDTTAHFQTIRNLADGGNLDEAARQCKIYLEQHPTSAEAYLLLGEVYRSKGDEEQAKKWLQKAIYLEPNYYEALIHLALIEEHLGDIAGATALQQRIQRLSKTRQM
jgi:chemotaxis protein methyltransferase WspC